MSTLLASSSTDSDPITDDEDLEFSPATEQRYRAHLHASLARRMPVIGIAAWAIFAIFIVLDLMYLPREVYEQTVAVRLLVNYPLIGLAIMAAVRHWPFSVFEAVVLSAYVVSGLSVVLVIYLADRQAVFLPYDGLLLLFVFGYFLLGMRFLPIVLASLLISFAYIGFEMYADRPANQLFLNAFFLFSLNLMGSFGCFIQDRARRKLFWRQLLIERAQEKDRKEIASKTRLVATASHDLRQPLHAMNLLVDTLKEQLDGLPQQALAGKLESSIRQLNQLLSSLLSISRLNAGIVEIKKQSLDLNALLDDLIAEISPRCEEQGLRVNLESSGAVTVMTDPVLLLRILRNLAENVLDHAQATRLTIGVSQRKNRVTLEICDDGLGIGYDQRDQVFEEFHRSGSASRKGLGLGLTIVRQLCELLGIALTLESDRGQGCCFTLDLGTPAVMKPASPGRPIVQGPLTGKRVLVVENDAENLHSMVERLEGWGLVVQGAACFEELGVGAVQQSSLSLSDDLDLLVTDLHLGEDKLNGLQGAEQMRRLFPEPMPVIVVTADTSIDDGSLDTTDGNSHDLMILQKPIQAVRLKLAISQMLSAPSQAHRNA